MAELHGDKTLAFVCRTCAFAPPSSAAQRAAPDRRLPRRFRPVCGFSGASP